MKGFELEKIAFNYYLEDLDETRIYFWSSDREGELYGMQIEVEDVVSATVTAQLAEPAVRTKRTCKMCLATIPRWKERG